MPINKKYIIGDCSMGHTIHVLLVLLVYFKNYELGTILKTSDTASDTHVFAYHHYQNHMNNSALIISDICKYN